MQPIVSDVHMPRTPTVLGFRRILNDADDQSPMDAKYAACQSFSLPHQSQQPQHIQHQPQHHQPQQRSPVAEIPLHQRAHNLPRPQIHTATTHFLPPQSQPLLPPLAVNSISPPNSSRPLLGLAPLRSVGRQCRLLGCVNPAKLQGFCLDHKQQQFSAATSPASPYYRQQIQHQQQQIHMTASYNTSLPMHCADPAPRPTLPPVRSEFSIPSLLSASPSPRERSPFAEQHTHYYHPHHHHPYSANQHRRTPMLPALRTVGIPFDDRVVSPAGSSAAPSPTSSTSSYSSYGHSSETTAARTPPASTSTAARTNNASTKPATKCRREHCPNAARRKGLCMEHGGRHFCKMDGCSKCAHRGGFCISHGGGRRCAVANCTKSAQSGGICYSHGGGKRCATDGCSHAARSGGFCIKHGKQQSQLSGSDELQ